MYVWIIDDDDAIRALMTTACQYFGVDVSGFQSVAEAIAALEAPGPHPDLCFADWTLKDGPALRVRPLMPETAFVVMSGNPDVEAILPPDVQWLMKPFHLSELDRLLKTAAASGRQS